MDDRELTRLLLAVHREDVAEAERQRAQPRERTPDRVSRRNVILKWASAAGIGGLMGGSGAGAAFASRRASDEIRRLEAANRRLEEDLKDLEASGVMEPIGLNTFAADFEEALQLSPEVDSNEPHRLLIPMSENVKLPYFAKLSMLWSAEEGQRQEEEIVYYWRNRALPRFVSHVFDRPEPNAGARAEAVECRFYTTKNARETLGVEGTISRSFSLLVARDRIEIQPPPDESRVTAEITNPSDLQEIDLDFTVKLTLTPPSVPDRRTASMVHLLVKPTDGASLWKGRVYIAPYRFATSSITEKTMLELPISIPGLIGEPGPEEYPTEIELLVIQSPGRLRGWELDANVLKRNAEWYKNSNKITVRLAKNGV